MRAYKVQTKTLTQAGSTKVQIVMTCPMPNFIQILIHRKKLMEHF